MPLPARTFAIQLLLIAGLSARTNQIRNNKVREFLKKSDTRITIRAITQWLTHLSGRLVDRLNTQKLTKFFTWSGCSLLWDDLWKFKRHNSLKYSLFMPKLTQWQNHFNSLNFKLFVRIISFAEIPGRVFTSTECLAVREWSTGPNTFHGYSSRTDSNNSDFPPFIWFSKASSISFSRSKMTASGCWEMKKRIFFHWRDFPSLYLFPFFYYAQHIFLILSHQGLCLLQWGHWEKLFWFLTTN